MLALPLEETYRIHSIVHLKAALTKYYALLPIRYQTFRAYLPSPIIINIMLVDILSRIPPWGQSTQSILSSLPSSLIRWFIHTSLLLHFPGYLWIPSAKLFGVPEKKSHMLNSKPSERLGIELNWCDLGIYGIRLDGATWILFFPVGRWRAVSLWSVCRLAALYWSTLCSSMAQLLIKGEFYHACCISILLIMFLLSIVLLITANYRQWVLSLPSQASWLVRLMHEYRGLIYFYLG